AAERLLALAPVLAPDSDPRLRVVRVAPSLERTGAVAAAPVRVLLHRASFVGPVSGPRALARRGGRCLFSDQDRPVRALACAPTRATRRHRNGRSVRAGRAGSDRVALARGSTCAGR